MAFMPCVFYLGNKFRLKVDYWNNKFEINKENKTLTNFARTLLNKKHRVNLVDKVIQ